MTLVACSVLKDLAGGAAKEALGVGGSDGGIELDAQIGDRETEVQAGGSRGTGDVSAKDNAKVTVNTSKTDTSIANAKKVTVQNIPPWVFLVALVGWLVPTPYGIWQYIKNKFKRS